MGSASRAFKWIIDIFKHHDVTFQVSGGLAATAYGSTRSIRDFDFDIANESFLKILSEVKSNVIFGPEYHRSVIYENLLLKLDREGQSIDIAGANDARIYDQEKQIWIKDPTDFTRCEMKNIYGIQVPVIHPEDLLICKRISPRPEDLVDIAAINMYLKG